MTFPLCNQADLPMADPQIAYEPKVFDHEGHERTQRRNGGAQCPECGLWWPLIEEPDEWNHKLQAIGWWGGVVCENCHLLIVEQLGGRMECYRIDS